MKKRRTEKKKRLDRRTRDRRMLMCDAIRMTLELTVGHALFSGDEDLQATIERLDALLRHEATTFLGIKDF